MRLERADFEVYRTEQMTQASTVLLLDMSRSMIYRGCFLAAKKVALALHSLIKSQFPRDNLYLVTFSLYARQIQPQQLTALRWSEWEYGTNLQHGLMHGRKLLARHKGGTRQIIVITDGEPTAYWEPGQSRRVLVSADAADAPARRCARSDAARGRASRINTFMLERSYGLMRFVDDITQHQSRPRLLRRSRAPGRLHPGRLPPAEIQTHRQLTRNPSAEGALGCKLTLTCRPNF